MKQQNYRVRDIPESLELRRSILSSLYKVESNLWSDDLETASKQIVEMHLQLVKLSRLQSVKRLENKFDQLYKLSNAHGLRIDIIKFEHKKAD